jgi:predicted deacylase
MGEALPTRELRSISVGTVSSGRHPDVTLHILVGAYPGPSLGLVGGLHGDEPFSIELVRRILEDLERLPLHGTVTALPCANPLAFQSLTRNTPSDMLDLNRVFPGDLDGMPSRQLAHAIHGVFVDECEVVLDFHSGGLFPTVDYVFIQGDEALARSIGSKVLYSGMPHPGSVSDCLRQAGLRTAVVEIGGGPVDGEPYVQRTLAGVRNALRSIGMLSGAVDSREDQVVVTELRDLSPHHGGLLISNVRAEELGDIAAEGRELCRILEVQTLKELEVLKTPFPQSVLILARHGSSPVGIGDFAYIVGNVTSIV